MFTDDFAEWDVPVGSGVTLHGRSGGAGPAVVLLHGHPRAHTTWHRVAPLLVAAGLRVICPDLRGYGRSSKPEPAADHSTYANRAMAQDVADLATQFGHDRFAVVGHDRGQGVAYRCALDHPDRTAALVVLDGIPALEAAERTDARFAKEWWHWFFFASSPHAERVINADPDAWYVLDDDKRAQMGAESFAYVRAALHDPLTVRAMLEDYRAGLSIDLEHDRHTRATGQTIGCPTLIGWSLRDDMEKLYGDPALIWESWVSGPLRTAQIDSDHHVAETNPDDLAAALIDFLPR